MHLCYFPLTRQEAVSTIQCVTLDSSYRNDSITAGLGITKSRDDRTQRDRILKYSNAPYFISIIFLICVFPADFSFAK